MELKKRIGIMGGTFDPPHLGHLVAAQAVLQQLRLDKIVFLPTGNFKYKDSSMASAAEKRFEMTSLAISDNPDFEICDAETKEKECSYTFSTLSKLHTIYENSHFFFIVGADSLDYMDKWKNPDMIFKQCSVAAVGRSGFDAEACRKKAKELEEKYNADIKIVSMPCIEISSTMIRQYVKEGKSIKYMVNDNVIEYINKQKLYLGD